MKGLKWGSSVPPVTASAVGLMSAGSSTSTAKGAPVDGCGGAVDAGPAVSVAADRLAATPQSQLKTLLRTWIP